MPTRTSSEHPIKDYYSKVVGNHVTTTEMQKDQEILQLKKDMKEMVNLINCLEYHVLQMPNTYTEHHPVDDLMERTKTILDKHYNLLD